jgi:BirA family biotin operon repressor/biotin-[acetyl-CoA-carboxylase] ligase
VIGSPRVHHRLTDSTNQRAKELADAGASHGTVVTADEQTAGRGRQGRSWVAPPGSAVLMSVVVRELDEVGALLPLAAALAVSDAAEACAPVRCEIKWPNDVWIDRRKLSGILVEGRPAAGWAVVGIGLNVLTPREAFPPELRDTATSLGAASGEAAPSGEAAFAPVPSVPAVLDALLAALSRRLESSPSEILSAWRERDALLGERISWGDGEGVAAGVDDSGSLLVDTDSGRIALGAGEVHLERLG